MFIHVNREKAIQWPMDHTAVPNLHVCPTGHHNILEWGWRGKGRNR